MSASLVKRQPRLKHQHLKKIMEYCPLAGIFRWKETISSHAIKGTTAGRLNARGYRIIQIDGEIFYGQRLAWFYHYGLWPKGVVNPKDGNKANLAIINLRDVDRGAAMRNQVKPHKRNLSGYVGVTYHKKSGKYAVQLVRKGERRRHYGLFSSPELASQHYEYIRSQQADAPYLLERLSKLSPEDLKAVGRYVERLSEEECNSLPPDNYDATAEAWVS